ncbi:MAG: hypothetical protein WCI47_03230 [bacterium]
MYQKASAAVTTIALQGLILTQRVQAAACDPGQGLDGGAGCGNTGGPTLTEGLKTVTNTLLFVIGIASVIMIIIGGMRYIFSGGDPKNTAAAKDTVLYAVIGIVVALLAYAIVQFTLRQFG